MPKKAPELGPLQVSRLKEPGFYEVGGVSGLALQIVDSGARSWVLRTMIGGKRRKMGLGGYPDVPLAQAREAAREAKKAIADGVDPIDQRRAAKQLLSVSRQKDVTFKTCAEQYLEAHKSSWANTKHIGQWQTTLKTYAYPVIGDMWVRDIAISHLMTILEPIWLNKTETAKRLRGRIEAIIDSAITRELRSGPNPARWKGNLSTLLASPNKVRESRPMRALPVLGVGQFMGQLRALQGTSARALEFLILTSVRSHNVRFATWSEIDMETKTWAIPGKDKKGTGQRMKAGKAHRVPLSRQAIQLLESLDQLDGSAFIFPSPRKGEQLSNMAMNKVLRDLKVPAVPHGFRSNFRDWAQDYTSFPREIAEMAMAHVVGDRTERAYLRSDAFKKRQRMMQMWADFCDVVRDQKGGDVVPIRVNAGG